MSGRDTERQRHRDEKETETEVGRDRQTHSETQGDRGEKIEQGLERKKRHGEETVREGARWGRQRQSEGRVAPSLPPPCTRTPPPSRYTT